MPFSSENRSTKAGAYRASADELRAIADQTKFEPTRERLLRVAENFDELAATADRAESRSDVQYR